ncbi:MAG: histidinol dehydrogenase [Actinomycetota bacterium]
MLEIIDGREQQTLVHIARPRAVSGRASAAAVEALVEDVRLRGDDALLEYTEKFDGIRLTPDRLRVEPDVLAKAPSLIPPPLVDAIAVMAERLRRTCERQQVAEWREEGAGEWVGEIVRPLRRVGIYAPGGRAAYPSSVVMAAVPATVAGVEQIAVCSPPGPDGEIPEPVLAACSLCGVDEVYRVGGAQAIAALAYGTRSVRPVEKIVGPGNIYVTLAKRAVSSWTGTDLHAGPSELAIVADDTLDTSVLAADLIAQAEHGPLGTHALITWLPEVAAGVAEELEQQIAGHPRSGDLENVFIEGGRAVLVRDLEHAIDTVNALAPEHLQLAFAGAEDALPQVRSAGSVFLGAYSAVPVGDYVGGTNHVLPTGGAARWSSGLGVPDFVKRIYVSSLDRASLERLGPHIEALAAAEGLPGHAEAIRRRLALDPDEGR